MNELEQSLISMEERAEKAEAERDELKARVETLSNHIIEFDNMWGKTHTKLSQLDEKMKIIIKETER